MIGKLNVLETLDEGQSVILQKLPSDDMRTQQLFQTRGPRLRDPDFELPAPRKSSSSVSM